MALKVEVDAIRRELGIAQDVPIVEVVRQAFEQLGLEDVPGATLTVKVAKGGVKPGVEPGLTLSACACALASVSVGALFSLLPALRCVCCSPNMGAGGVHLHHPRLPLPDHPRSGARGALPPQRSLPRNRLDPPALASHPAATCAPNAHSVA